MDQRSFPLIPNDYVTRVARNQIGGQRTITVRKYTVMPLHSREEVVSAIQNSSLTFGDNFGVIQSHDLEDKSRNPRMLCGLVGERNLILINQSTNKPDYLKVRNVLLATILVEFITSEEKLELIVYGGKQGNKELVTLLKEKFGITEFTPQVFSDESVRKLCENRFDRLFHIEIDPYDKDGWGTINYANFKSGRGQYIRSDVERMKQILENKEIFIRSFRSMLHNQTMPPLQDYYDIKFEVLKDRGVSIDLPELILPRATDVSYETILYDFARKAYLIIIGDEELHEVVTETDDTTQQLTLFDLYPDILDSE